MGQASNWLVNQLQADVHLTIPKTLPWMIWFLIASQMRRSATSKCEWSVSYHSCLPCTKASGCHPKDKLRPSLQGRDLVEQRRIVSSGLHGKQRKWYWPWVHSQLASSFWLTSSNPSRMFTRSLLRFRVIFCFISCRAAPFHIFEIANNLCTYFNQSIVKSLHLMMYPLFRSSLSIGRCPLWLPISCTHPSRTPRSTT
jgi:hypothetical protein